MPHEANIGRQPNVTGAPLFDPRQGPRDIPQESDIDLIGIISRMLAGEADPNVQQAAAGIADAPVSLGAASGGIDADYPLDDAAQTAALEAQGQQFATNAAETAALTGNIPTIQADPNPVRVRPPGFVEDPRNESTFPPSQEVPIDVNEPTPFAGTNRQQQQQESLQDYNPSLEMVTGMPGSQNNFPGVGTFDPLQVDSRQVSPSVNRDFLFEPAVKQKTLEEQLFEIIQQAGNA